MPFSSPRRMTPFDLDPHGRLSLPALVRHLQDAADQHAEPGRLRLADLVPQGRQWIITDFVVELDRGLGTYEPFVVETWVAEGGKGIRALRDWRVRDAAGVEVGRAKSTWVMLDRATRRPRALEPGHFTPEPGVELRHVRATPAAGEHPATTLDFPVVWTDLDINRHANNVRYFEWMLAAAPAEVLSTKQPRHFDVRFQREASAGMIVRSATFLTGDGGALFHHVSDSATGQTLALGRSLWE